MYGYFAFGSRIGTGPQVGAIKVLTLPRSGLKSPIDRELELSHPKGNGKPGKVPVLRPGPRHSGEPGWAKGLRKLYDSVVDEPLPDSFKDLLRKLDGGSDA